MAITFVGSAYATAVDGNDATIDLTTISGLQEDDLVLVMGIARDNDLGPTSGYTEFAREDAQGGSGVIAFGKFMGATVDTEVVCNGSSNAAWPCAYQARVYRGVDSTTPQDATATTNTGNGSPVEPADITTVTDGAWVVPLYGHLNGTGGETLVTGTPSGYGNVLTIDEEDDSTRYVAFSAVDKEIATAGAESPGNWTNEGGNSWNQITLALRPGASEDALTASDLTGGTPSLDSPSLGQEHDLTATAITNGAPVLDSPALGQEHALTASEVTAGAAVLETPTLGVVHPLTADAITTGAPLLDTPTLGQEHALTATEVTAGAPVLDTPTVTEATPVTADPITTGAPVLDSPTLGQVHVLTADDVIAGAPVFDLPTLTVPGSQDDAGLALLLAMGGSKKKKKRKRREEWWERDEEDHWWDEPEDRPETPKEAAQAVSVVKRVLPEENRSALAEMLPAAKPWFDNRVSVKSIQSVDGWREILDRMGDLLARMEEEERRRAAEEERKRRLRIQRDDDEIITLLMESMRF